MHKGDCMKRFFSVLLCVLLLFSLAVPAFAEGDIYNNYTNETDLTPVTSWLRDLYDTLTERLTNVGNNIANGFNYLYDTLRNVVDNAKTAVMNSIDALKTAMKDLGKEVNARVKAVENYVSYVYTRMNNIYEDFKQKAVEKIEYYFIPTFSIQEQVETWKLTIENKFEFYKQISTMLNRIFTFSETAEAPKFNITYKGVTVGIVDFSAYAQARKLVQAMILFFAWFSFLRRLYHSIPNIIMGGGYAGSSRTDSRDGSVIHSYIESGQRYDVISKR